MTTSTWQSGLVAVLFFLLATTYSVITPIFESPDELWHYPFVWHLARTAQLPVQDTANPQLWQQEGSQPPLYYALAALITAPIAADDLPALIRRNPHADIGVVSPDGNANIVIHTGQEHWPWRGAVLALHLARLVSVLLEAGTVLTIFALSHRLWPRQPTFALVAAAFVAFNPMFIFVAASVNNDNMIILLAALILWQLVVLVTGPGEPPLWRFGLLGLLGGLAALSKVSGLGLVGLTGLTLLVWGARQRRWKIALLYNGLAGLIALAVAGWWYWRNVALYGDWTGTEIMVAMMGPRPISPTGWQLLSELPGLARSFWGLFGYFSVAMPGWIYLLLNLMLAAGAAGWLIILFKKERLPPGLRKSWLILLGWLVILLVGFVQWTLRTPATQGRLLFPALAAVTPLWAAGWLALVPRHLKLLPAGLMLAVAVWTPGGVIAPAYAPPPTFEQIPASAHPLDVNFGDTASLLGYKLSSNRLKPGDALAVSLYWRAGQPAVRDFTVFLHLVDQYNLIVAQRDVLPGPGVYPTSQWQPGRQFVDTYVLHIPTTSYAPAQAVLRLGLYDAGTGQRLPVSTGGDSVTFGQVEIEPRDGALPNPQQLRFADGIWLVGYQLSRRRAAPGETIALTLYWQASDSPAEDYKVFVHMVNSSGVRTAQHDSEPQAGAAPTSTWTPAQIVTDVHPLTITTDAPPGVYRIVVGLYQDSTGQRLSLLQNGRAWVQADSVTLPGIRVASP